MPTIRLAARSVLSLLAVLLLTSAPAAAQSGRAQGLLGEIVSPPKFEHLSRLAGRLVIPVQGVRPERLRDSFREARSGGRVHQAIDIHAPKGTPVVAVADGTILKLHQGAKGGISVYHLDTDGRTRYYYAHLERYADGLREGQKVKQGEVIGYVGDTGNATPGDFHLHFSVALLRDARRWWEGSNLNPYALLRTARSATSDE